MLFNQHTEKTLLGMLAVLEQTATHTIVWSIEMSPLDFIIAMGKITIVHPSDGAPLPKFISLHGIEPCWGSCIISEENIPKR